MAHVRALQTEKLHLAVEAAGIAGEAAAGAHHPVTGDEQGNGVVPHRAAHGLGGHLVPALSAGQLSGDLAVGHGLAVGDGQHDVAHGLAKGSGIIAQGREKIGALAGKIDVQPAHGLPEQRVLLRLGVRRKGAAKVLLAAEPKPDDGALVASEGDRAQGGGVLSGVGHGETSLVRIYFIPF